MKKGLIKDILLKLKDDFSNIDEVYTSLKSSWLEANPDHSELDFMDSFDFSNGYDVDTINKDLFTETQLKNLHQLSTYLGKKRGTVARTPNDHYKSYLKSKRFGFVLIKAFKNKDFESVVKRLNDYKDTYDYILSKLDKHEQIEFKYDYFYQLEKLKSKQQFPKFKKVIDMQLLKINGQCDKNQPQQEPNKKKENPYPEIFKNAFSFRLFERLHMDYKDSNSLLADYSFIYRKMCEKKHIVEYQKPEMFRDWLSKEPYEIILDNKFKTLDRCKTDTKERNFKLTLDLMEKI